MALDIGSMNGYRNYQNNTRSINNTMRQLSSGYRINSAADDAAGLAIAEGMRTQITTDQVKYNAAQMEVNAAQTADGALSSVQDSLSRMRELAAQASNGTYTDVDRGMLQKEFSQLTDQINTVYKSTNFNGKTLLDNTLDLGSLNISTQSGAMDAMSALEQSINAVSDQRGNFGAQQNRAETDANILMNSMINTQQSESEIRDLDIALAVMENTKKQILSQSSLFVMAQAKQNAAGVMRFFQ